MSWKDLILKSMDERVYNRLIYYYLHLKCGRVPKPLNLKNPRTFNEKTIWLKMNHRYPNATVLADKHLVKEFVRERVGDRYIIPTIKVFDRAADVNVEELPRTFVLKANHGSGWNVICRDKAEFDFAGLHERLGRWLRTSYYDLGKEYQYRDIVPKIVCEAYLENTQEHPLLDYKVFCFSGKPKLIQVDLDRFTNHKRNFYDLDWELIPFTTLYPRGSGNVPRPDALEEMLSVAETLASGLKFARVDLYWHEERVYFGEITLHHGGGFEPFIPAKYDELLGEYLVL